MAEKVERFPMKKPFFHSRVNWVGIVIVVLSILQLLVTLLATHGDWKSWALAIATFVMGVAVIVLRNWFIFDTR